MLESADRRNPIRLAWTYFRRIPTYVITARGVATGVYIGINLYPPPTKKKSAQVNFLWGKNDVKTAIEQFYTPKNFYTPQNKFLATPLIKTH